MAQPSRNGKQAYLGTFPTAVEAAVAMAKYMQERGEDEDEDDGLPSESQGIELHKRRENLRAVTSASTKTNLGSKRVSATTESRSPWVNSTPQSTPQWRSRGT